MKALRIFLPAAAAASIFSAAPASAQFFLQKPALAGAPMRGDEPGLAIPLPGATPEELRASLVWTLRAGLNVAALQCDFEPTLLTVPNYNAVLADHNAELKSSFDTLGKYFARTTKSKKAAMAGLDQFGTRVYSSFSTVSAQYNFCQTASEIGHDALWVKRGQLGEIAKDRMRELRNSLVPYGEQRFPGRNSIPVNIAMPRFAADCWTRKNTYDYKRCPLSYE
ncbi:MAG: hypothetical protein B7Y45_12615 [Sphingomonas sp. 28-66-16]|nr:MAG: hypothetical protein B7Y45_12615 [Sphingomonas sp. 28-66-16]